MMRLPAVLLFTLLLPLSTLPHPTSPPLTGQPRPLRFLPNWLSKSRPHLRLAANPAEAMAAYHDRDLERIHTRIRDDAIYNPALVSREAFLSDAAKR